MNFISAPCAAAEGIISRKLAQFCPSPSQSALGEKLFSKRILELPPFKGVPISEWDDWEQDPLSNRSWQWRLHWLAFLPYLSAYHYVSRNEDVLTFALGAVQSWLDRYLRTDVDYPFEFIWHDHATALRAEQLSLFWYYCRRHAPCWSKRHQKFLLYIQEAVTLHAQRLAEESFYSAHTNHGLEQARVLLFLSTILDGAVADKWQRLAIERIKAELEFSFTCEGVHVENSPAYHIFVFKLFKDIISDYQQELLGDLSERFHLLAGRALRFVTYVLRPDGNLPPVGDTEQLPTSDAYREMLGKTEAYKQFAYALSQGGKGEKPLQVNVVYPASGYAIFRDRWPDRDRYSQAFHIVVKVGCSSRYHHQQDEGHVSVYAGGEDWLIDSGLYNYINKDPIRRYMRSRQGHNVPLISDASYAEDFDHRLGAWKVLEYNEEEDSPSITMQLKVLLPVEHIRSVRFNAATKVLELADSFSSDDNQERNFILQWHVPRDKKVAIEGRRVVVESARGSRMLIDVDGPDPTLISAASGIRDGRVLSCISYRANHYEPSQVLRVAYRGYKALDVRTRFTFELSE